MPGTYRKFKLNQNNWDLAGFDPLLDTVVIIHGYMSWPLAKHFADLAKTFVSKGI